MKAIFKQVQNSRIGSEPRDQPWDGIPGTFRAGGLLPRRWEDLFGPLRNATVDDLVIIAQMGQSLDGRIATPTGHSHYINGVAGRMTREFAEQIVSPAIETVAAPEARRVLQ